MDSSKYTSGDVILITTRMKAGEEVRIGEVTHIFKGTVMFAPYYGPLNEGRKYLETGTGGFNQAGEKQFGVQRVEIIGKVSPYSHWYPRPGDRGYDLMC